MPREVEWARIELDGQEYLCCAWYESEHKLWYGKTRLSCQTLVLCFAVSRDGLLMKLKMEIGHKIGLLKRKK